MADQGLWFKLWATCLTDPDLRNLSLEDFARWCLLGTFMKVHGNNGTLRVIKPALALQENMRCKSYEDVLLTLQKFPNCVVHEEGKRGTDAIVPLIIEWKNWSKYQGDYSTYRTKRFKERERFKRRREEKRKEEKETITPKSPRTFFVPPTSQEVKDYARSIGFSSLDAEQFCAHYEASGWMRGRSKITNWKQCVVTWKKNHEKGGFDGSRTTNRAQPDMRVAPIPGKYANIDE